MIIHTVWWDLTESEQTIETLRAYLRDESVDAFSHVRGLLLKIWIADPDTDRWGAVLMWDSTHSAGQPLPSRATDLIGYPPTHTHAYEVEATCQGPHDLPHLAGLGNALNTDP